MLPIVGGGIVFGYPYEPIPVGCVGKLPSDGCCYPAPLSSSLHD